MRPSTIVAFEILYFVTLACGGLQAYFSWQQLQAEFIIGVQVFTVALLVALVLLVSRGRRKSAKWVLVVLFALGLPITVRIFLSGDLAGSALLTVTQTVLLLIGLALLFTPSERRWLDRKAVPNPI